MTRSLAAQREQATEFDAFPPQGADQQRDTAGLHGNHSSPWLTSDEAAAYIRRDTMGAFYSWCYRHRIAAAGSGRKRLYSRRDLDVAVGAHASTVGRRCA